MKYLVTGACGFTGSHTVDILMEKGEDVRATDLESADRQYVPDTVEFIPSDVTDIESLKRVVEDVDIILHPAAIFDFSAPMELLERVNVQGMENLCQVAKAAGVKRLVSWSSSGVYGKQECDNPPITEDFTVAPIENYSRTKAKQDEIALRYNDTKGMTTSIIRPGVVYGPRSRYGAMQIFEALSMMPVIPLPSNFDFHLGPVHARDIGGAGIFVSTKKEAAGEIYGVVDCSDISMTDFLTLVAKAHGAKVIPIPIPIKLARAGGLLVGEISDFIAKHITKKKSLIEKIPIEYFPVDLWISNQKLLDLGYQFEYPHPEEGIRETIDWMKQTGEIGLKTLRKYF